MQACFSSIETVCARGTEPKDDGEGQGGVLALMTTIVGGGQWEEGRVRVVGSVLCSWCLPGDHGAGLRMAGGGGGGAELREAAVARLQTGHGTPTEGDRTREQVSRHTLHIGQQTQSNTRATAACQQPAECTLCRTMQLEEGGWGGGRSLCGTQGSGSTVQLQQPIVQQVGRG